MIKKLLVFLLVISMLFTLNLGMLAQNAVAEGSENENGNEGDVPIFEGGLDSEGNYIPLIIYYSAILSPLDNTINLKEIDSVTLKIGDNEYEAELQSDGSFTYAIPDVNETVYVSIKNKEYYIPSDYPEYNNQVFPSVSENPSKTIYIGRKATIKGTVTDSTGSVKINGATVTCYKLNPLTHEWELWRDNELESSANKTTDSEGNFEFAVISGEYKFTCYSPNYDFYDSMNYEYVHGGKSTIVPNSATFNLNIHLTASKSLDLITQTLSSIHKSGTIVLEFDKPVSSASASDINNIKLVRVGGTSYTPLNVTVSGNKVTLKPKAELFENSKYNIYLTTGLKSTDGSRLSSDRIITFTVSSASGNDGGNSSNTDTDTDTETDNSDMPSGFTDIQDHWAYEYIIDLVNAEIIPQGSSLYYPDISLTREEFARYIVLALGYELVEYQSGLYADESTINSNYLKYVATAYKNGLIVGNIESDGLYYRPKESITRAEIITILGRLFTEASVVPDFVDMADTPEWAVPYVSSCLASGLIEGSQEADGLYLFPLKNITRAEASTIVSRLRKSVQR